MALSALLGILTLLGLISPVLLLLILFVVEVFDALAGPAWQTLIPEIVGTKDMRPAITLNPLSVGVKAGENAVFEATASGAPAKSKIHGR